MKNAWQTVPLVSKPFATTSQSSIIPVTTINAESVTGGEVHVELTGLFQKEHLINKRSKKSPKPRMVRQALKA